MSAFRDIALKAGVSVKTVPRVLNSVPMVGADTRARVENVIREVGYVQNILAQRLARSRAMVIGLINHNTTRAYLSDVLEGSLEVARQRGYGIMTRLIDVNSLEGREDLVEVQFAGSFETYINPASARTIGLVPAVPVERIVAVGNAACEGAKMALLSYREREAAARIPEFVEYLELSGRPEFNDIFAEALAFPHRSD